MLSAMRREFQQSGSGAELNRQRILVLEDEFFIAEDIADALKQAGAEVVGPIGCLAQAEETLASGDVAGAVLDMNLRGEQAFGLAERLRSADVPFVIVSGYSHAAIPSTLHDVPHLEKPVEPARVVEALEVLLAGGVMGANAH
jgi:DNA-binding response OmpR family regulator